MPIIDDAFLEDLRQRVAAVESADAEKPVASPSASRDGSGSPSAFDRMVRLCSVRDRSVAELRRRLRDDEYTEEEVDDALRRGLDCGLLDDARFADAFIRGRVSAGKGRAVIERDLESHGIDASALPGWPDDYRCDEASQMESALSLLERKPPHSKDPWGSAYRKLISRGYTADVATRAARCWAEHRD